MGQKHKKHQLHGLPKLHHLLFVQLHILHVTFRHQSGDVQL